MAVPVLKRSMAKGSAIGSQDFIQEDRDVTYIASDDFPDANDIIGSSLNRSAQAGTVLTRSMLQTGAYIRSGDKVNIIVHSGAVRIRTAGTALQDAASGSTVRVKREGTQNILQGTVDSDGSVLISTGR
jgi:flagella basal body P-ring formation protein FlgA